MFRLEECAYLITGGARGVGLAIAQELGGARVRILRNGRNGDRSAAVVAALGAEGGTAVGVAYAAGGEEPAARFGDAEGVVDKRVISVLNLAHLTTSGDYVVDEGMRVGKPRE